MANILKNKTILLGLIFLVMPLSAATASEQCVALFESGTLSYENQVKIASQYQAVGLAVNKFLRTGNPMWTNFIPQGETMGDYIKSMDQMISNAPIGQNMVLYRGETHTDKSEIPSKGQIILRKNYVSTSDDLAVAEQFTKGTVGLIFRIHLQKGQKALSLSPFLSDPREREYLLPRDTEFSVLSIQESPGYWLIDVNVR